MEKIILVSGKSNSGKGVFTDLLKEKLESKNKKVVVIPFAKYIKLYLKDYYGWDGINKDESIRNILQYLGSDKIRNEMNMKNFHCSRVCDDIRILEDDFDYFIIDDVRYTNEVYYTKSIFGDKVIDVRVNRPNFNSPLTEKQQNHESEVGLDSFKFMYYVENNGFEDLDFNSDNFIENFL